MAVRGDFILHSAFFLLPFFTSSVTSVSSAASGRSRLARAASSSWISPSPPSDGGEGWGEEVRFYWFPLSSVLSPLVPRGERMESLMQPCRLAFSTFFL